MRTKKIHVKNFRGGGGGGDPGTAPSPLNTAHEVYHVGPKGQQKHIMQLNHERIQ